VAYAIQAVPRRDAPTGQALAAAFRRLAEPHGTSIAVGSRQIFDAYGLLRGGEAIDLEGTVGHLDLDPRTGESSIDMAILCVGVDDHGVAQDTVESQMVYQAKERKLVGELHCP
jgi:hypothetical protein